MSNPSTRPSRSRRWPLVLVLGLVVGARRRMDRVLVLRSRRKPRPRSLAGASAKRQAGRRQDCASLSVGGYPFRIEVRCADGNFELARHPDAAA